MAECVDYLAVDGNFLARRGGAFVCIWYIGGSGVGTDLQVVAYRRSALGLRFNQGIRE